MVKELYVFESDTHIVSLYGKKSIHPSTLSKLSDFTRSIFLSSLAKDPIEFLPCFKLLKIWPKIRICHHLSFQGTIGY